MANVKQSLFVFAKIAVAAALVAWMIASGKLDFASSAIVLEKPSILIVCLSAWMFTTTLCNSLRWRFLVNAIGIALSRFAAIQISLIGLFFNTFLPGSVGGDIMKAVYVYKNHPGGQKTPAMLTIILDRILGLCSLFVLVVPIIIWQWSSLGKNPLLWSLSVTTLLIACGMLVFVTSVFIPWPKDNDPFLWLFKKSLPGFGVLEKIYTALRYYKEKPWAIIKSLLLSIVSQSYLIFAVSYITMQMVPNPVDFLELATIMPLGILATAIPLAPGGIGVGHVAFERLFHIVNIDQGANIYNIFFLTVTLPNMLGVIPYLLMKDKQLTYIGNE